MSEESIPDTSVDNNVMTILVATDNHLGYNEKDSMRGSDSFVVFEEILANAVKHDVDFILLGGDLFHDSKPSPNALNRCMKLLRRYTLGDKPIGIEILSDQSLNFPTTLNQTLNYEDPNVNIAYPVFSIHGNHDDPSGFGGLSALDLMSTNGLINYFGKCTDLTNVVIDPILLKKGSTQLALYGLSYLHDNRLARLFKDSKVLMNQPPDDSGEWCSLMVVHQNRADRGHLNYLPEKILPEFLDLIIWGHEHDCRIHPEPIAERDFYVSQPGSSVATSLSEGESIDKHIGLLQVRGSDFKMTPIKLQTVRPFIFDSVNMSEYVEGLGLDEGNIPAKIQKFVAERIESMMEEAKKKLTGHPNQPKEPLIRLRITYNEEDQMFNTIRFGQQYKDTVANPGDLILFKKCPKRSKTEQNHLDMKALGDALAQTSQTSASRVEDIVDRYFTEVDTKSPLEILNSKSVYEICRRLVDNDDDDAMKSIVSKHHERACAYLNEKMPVDEDVADELFEFKNAQGTDVFELILQGLDARGSTVTVPEASTTGENGSGDENEYMLSTNKARVPATSKATAAATRKTSADARTASANVDLTNEEDDDMQPPARRGRGAAAGRGSRGRGGPTKTVTPTKKALNISVTHAKITQQPTISESFSSQPKLSQRLAAKKPTRFTQYISDSDSD